ncbi:60S ribosomal protein L38 [Clarireedia jacksonii]
MHDGVESNRRAPGGSRTARIKKNPNGVSKIKVRCQRYLYTISVKDADKAEKLKQSLPPNLTITDIPKKNAKGKHTA